MGSDPNSFLPSTRPSDLPPDEQDGFEDAPTQPTWLHWSSLLFDIISHSRRYLIPALVALFSAARGNVYGVIFAGLFFFPSIFSSIFRYFTLRYHIHRGQLIVVQGLLFRSIRTVPVARIQNIDLVQNVLHRLFNVAEVRIETASGKEPEATLRVLSLAQVEALRNEIFAEISPAYQDEIGMPAHAVAPHRSARYPQAGQEYAAESTRETSASHSYTSRTANEETLVAIPVSWLVRAGLASDRGMVLVGIALGLMYQFELFERVNLRALGNLLPQDFDRTTIAVASAFILLALFILLRIFGVAWYLLRFFDFRLRMRGNDLQISCGLLTKVSASVPRNRVQLISIQRNWMMRAMGLSSIRIETAGSATNHEDASQTVSRRWFLPVISDQLLPKILQSLRPGLSYTPDAYDWIHLSPRAFVRRLRVGIVISAVIGITGYYFYPPWGGLVAVVAIGFLALQAHFAVRWTRYVRWEEGVIFETGCLNRKTTFTFFEKLQAIRLEQSPFDRRWKMAQLTIDTAGAGPAEHPLVISSLESNFAIEEQIALTHLSAQHQTHFA
jgi:putative membrane protein